MNKQETSDFISSQLRVIADRSSPERRAGVDYLNDLVEGGAMDGKEGPQLIRSLCAQLKEERDEDVVESIFNLLVSAHIRGIEVEFVEEIAEQRLPTLSTGAALHAIGLLGESRSSKRREMLLSYRPTANSIVQAEIDTFLATTRDTEIESGAVQPLTLEEFRRRTSGAR